MKSRANKTEAEKNLSDMINQNKQISDKEQSIQLEKVVNALFSEAIKDGYKLSYNEIEGIQLHTPSGLTFVFYPKNKINEWDMEILVIGITHKK